MTDRLQQAQHELKTYYEQREYAAEHASDFAAENAADSLRLAELHAQLASAEALTRIADALETMLEQDTLAENVRIWGTERNER